MLFRNRSEKRFSTINKRNNQKHWSELLGKVKTLIGNSLTTNFQYEHTKKNNANKLVELKTQDKWPNSGFITRETEWNKIANFLPFHRFRCIEININSAFLGHVDGARFGISWDSFIYSFSITNWRYNMRARMLSWIFVDKIQRIPFRTYRARRHSSQLSRKGERCTKLFYFSFISIPAHDKSVLFDHPHLIRH